MLLPESDPLPDESFLDKCREYRDLGYQFLGLHTEGCLVRYLFCGEGGAVAVEQAIVDGGVHSIAYIFPLADFAERQMYRDCQVKAIGNINLVPRED